MKFTPKRTEDFTLVELGNWVMDCHPNFIIMSERDERWYRMLLPDAFTSSVVTYRGIPIVIEQPV